VSRRRLGVVDVGQETYAASLAVVRRARASLAALCDVGRRQPAASDDPPGEKRAACARATA